MSVRHHPSRPGKPEFMNQEAIEEEISRMEDNAMLNTSAITLKDDDGVSRRITFRQKHLTYLGTHPRVNPKYYLANVKTMIRKRT